MLKRLLYAILAAATVFSTGTATAQPYPTRSVTIVVPQAAAGATDVFARYMAQHLGRLWGQSVVVENKAGAAGIVGTDAVAKANPDGHTLLLTYAGSQAVNQSLYAKLPFDSVKDFATVATVATTPFFLVTGAQSQTQSLRKLIARAKAKPGEVTYSTSGNGSVNHLLSESLNVEAGIRTVHVPYKAISAALTDVISGTVDVAFAAVPSALQLIKAGKLRAIAVSSANRNPSLPEVPSIAELGYPQFAVSPWWGILAPARTPKAVVTRVNADVVQILKCPEAQAFFREQGAEIMITTPEAFQDLLESDIAKWAKVVKASGARLD